MNSTCKYIIVAALALETKGLEALSPVVHTGVGKVNAAIQCFQAILDYQPELVINYGTAGTVDNTYGLLQVETFVNRDIDVRCLGFPRGVTPYSDQGLPEPTGIVLASGDSFVTNSKTQLEGLEIPVSLIDMEAYALKEVCKHHNVNFECYKYVTDNSDKNASEDWEKNVRGGVSMLIELLQKKYGTSLLLDQYR